MNEPEGKRTTICRYLTITIDIAKLKSQVTLKFCVMFICHLFDNLCKLPPLLILLLKGKKITCFVKTRDGIRNSFLRSKF